eukprot:m.377413 g.377413  ORF g.377413 m.377413 type:complete len:53 (-) comp86883_c0_seq1:48-206(-)
MERQETILIFKRWKPFGNGAFVVIAIRITGEWQSTSYDVHHDRQGDNFNRSL